MDNVYIVGDINSQQYKLMVKLEQRKIKESYIFVLGNFGIGKLSDSQQNENLSSLNEKLIKNKNVLYLIRGDVDDKDKFSSLDKKYSNIGFLDDIEYVTIDENDILCIGGSVDIDRLYHFEWKREKPKLFYSYDLKQHNADVILSHDSPDFVHPYSLLQLKSFTRFDKWLYNDITKNRKKLTKIYEELRTRKIKIHSWYTSKYDKQILENKDDVNFHHLKKFEIKNLII